ncbi:UBX domain-containing protein 2A isoform X4 [Nerophis ophidion]|nr:UBX domain-containing protein 2A isoform X4 [Nerophis ophidion]
MVVRLWKDGFTVNDQEFRSYSVPENQQFLDAIKRGELPAEWESRAEEEELEVNVEDLTEEAYVPKKKVFHPFSGRGYRLGSVAPRVVARSPSVHEDGESPPIPMVTLNHALPVTSLQIWLADGRRLVQRFNLSHRPSIHPSIFGAAGGAGAYLSYNRAEGGVHPGQVTISSQVHVFGWGRKPEYPEGTHAVTENMQTPHMKILSPGLNPGLLRPSYCEADALTPLPP